MLLWWLAALPVDGKEALGTAVVSIQGPRSGGWVVVGLLCVGLLGVAIEGTPGCPISRLTKKIRRVEQGEQSIDFTTDRDDEIGDLYDAVGDLVDNRCASEDALQESERYRRRLYDITSNTDLDADEKIDRLLALGRERLGVESTVITDIDQESGRYEIQRANGSDFVTAGTVTDLSETFCRKTVTADDSLGVYNAHEGGYENDPAYDQWGISCYLGTKIMIDDELAGTLCFIDSEPREMIFSHTEKVFVDLIGRWISHVFERRDRATELERYEDLVASAPVATFLTSVDGTILDVNQAFADQFGADSTAEMYEHEASELWVDRADREKLLEKVQREATVQRELSRMQTLDGEERWIEVTMSLTQGDASERLVGICHDVTEREQREQRLQELNEEYETVLDNTQDAIFLVDVEADDEFRIARINNAEEDVLGLSASEATGKEIGELFDEEIANSVRSRYRECLEEQEPVDYEETYDLPDETATFQTKLSPVVRDGEIEQIVGVTRDLTRRKERERQLRERERELQRTKEMLQQSQRLARVGAWELDVRGSEPSLFQTDEVYRIYDLPTDADMAYEGVFEVVHPDDRQHVRDHVERAVDLGESYDIEFQVVTATGDTRWLRAIADPVTEDGDVVAVRASIQDVTDQKQREFALESLQESTQELLMTETIEDAASLVVDAAASILDVDAVGIYQYDDTENVLTPAALSSDFEACYNEDVRAIGPGTESFLWHSYVTGTLSAIDNTAPIPEDGALVSSVSSGIVVPIGGHGVFVAVDESDRLDESTRRLIETLVATTEAAFDRIESEASLREREAEIEAQNERLRRQIRINETIRSVSQSLIGATSQSELEEDVCERLAAGDDIAFAWIGEFDSAGQSLRAREWAGAEQGYLDSASLDSSGETLEPAVETAVTGEPTVVSTVAQNVQQEAWRRTALASNFQSVLAVPITLDEYSYGVLTVYAPETDMFGTLEETVFAELGESIANAISSVTTKQALHSDTLVSLTLRVEDTGDQFTGIAAAAGCTVHYEGLATRSAEETRLFVRTTGADASTVADGLDGRHAISHYRHVSESDDGDVFELALRGESIVSKMVRHGGRPQSIEATADGSDIVVDVPMSTDVRSFVEMVGQEQSVELVSKREVTRSLQSQERLVDAILEHLTERQQEVLRTAFFAGFFNWPRDTTGEEIAEMLDVSQPTVNRHLRRGQQRVMCQLFERRTTAEPE